MVDMNLSRLEPKCIWFTGLSGSGKTTLANALVGQLQSAGKLAYLLDGDVLRCGLNKDLGFTDADRIESVRRAAELARLMANAGLIAVVALISPFARDRAMARGLFIEHEFIEVFVDAPLAVCERRDIKGLYERARNGELVNFTGVDSPYEAPKNAEIIIDTQRLSVEESGAAILRYMYQLQN